MKRTARGTMVLSIDVELSWGRFDVLPMAILDAEAQEERTLITRLLALLDRYDIPATWAMVGHLMIERCARDPNGQAHPEVQPRPAFSWLPYDWYHFDPCTSAEKAPGWYAPDILRSVRAARTRHEIGSHSFAHIYYGDPACCPEAAEADLKAAIETAARNGITLKSFVFPRNRVGHLEALRKAGILAFRGMHPFEEQKHSPFMKLVLKPISAMGQLLGLPPTPVRAEEVLPGLWDLPGNHYFRARTGLRRILPPGTEALKGTRGINQAVRSGGLYHVWFHPYNLRQNPHEMFSNLEGLFAYAAQMREEGLLKILTMGDYAECLELDKSSAEAAAAQAHSPLDPHRGTKASMPSPLSLNAGSLSLTQLEPHRSCARQITAECVHSVTELAELSVEWRELFHRIGCRTPFVSVDWIDAWWNHWGARHHLWVVTVRNETGRLVAVAPFYLRRSCFGVFGSRVLCFLGDRNVGSDHLNVLVEPAYEESAIEAIAELVVAHRGEWDFLELADSEEASPTLCRLSQQLQARGMTRLVTRTIDCPFTPLPATFEQYLAGLSANLRYNFRRRWRALEREGVKFVSYQGGNEFYVRFCDLVHLHRLRFLDQDRVSSFLAPKVQAFHAEALQRMAAGGLARLFTLEIGSHTIAALYGFSAGRTFSFYQSGMDPAWARLSAGLVLMGCSIREAIHNGHDTFDFLRGDETYKFQWATQSRKAVTLCFFDRRVRSRLARWRFQALSQLAWVKRLARRTIKAILRLLPKGEGGINGPRPEGTVPHKEEQAT